MKPKLMVEAAAILEIPLEQAMAKFLHVETGPSGRVWLLGDAPAPVTGGPERFTVTQNQYRLRVDVDHARRTIATQGGWWYRGEYTLDPEGPHTRLTHRVYNVAGPASRWSVPLANRLFIGFGAQTRTAFAQSVADLGLRLDCRAHPLDPAGV